MKANGDALQKFLKEAAEELQVDEYHAIVIYIKNHEDAVRSDCHTKKEKKTQICDPNRTESLTKVTVHT
jgi:hypothetical protein